MNIRIRIFCRAPGLKVSPEAIAKGPNIPSQGGEFNDTGAGAVTFSPEGDANGSYRAVTVTEGGFETVRTC